MRGAFVCKTYCIRHDASTLSYFCQIPTRAGRKSYREETGEHGKQSTSSASHIRDIGCPYSLEPCLRDVPGTVLVSMALQVHRRHPNWSFEPSMTTPDTPRHIRNQDREKLFQAFTGVSEATNLTTGLLGQYITQGGERERGERKNARSSLGVQSVLERISQFPVVVQCTATCPSGARRTKRRLNPSDGYSVLKVKPRSRHDPDRIRVTSRIGRQVHHAWDRWRTIATSPQ